MRPGTFRFLTIAYTAETHLADLVYEKYTCTECRTFLLASRVQTERVFLTQMAERFHTSGQVWPISPSLPILPLLPFFSHLNDFCHTSQGLHTPSSLLEKFYPFRPFPQSGALNIKNIFAEMIKSRMLRLPWIIWVSPRCNHSCLLKWQPGGDFIFTEGKEDDSWDHRSGIRVMLPQA